MDGNRMSTRQRKKKSSSLKKESIPTQVNLAKYFAQLPLGSIVTVEWVDSGFEKGWIYENQTAPLARVHSSGFLSYVGSNAVEVCSSLALRHDGKSSHAKLNPLLIPMGCITDAHLLRLPLREPK